MKHSVAVLILVHKDNPSREEIASLRQCRKVLHRYPIVLVCPSGLNISAYIREVPDLLICSIDPIWQSTYAMFNKLKIAPLLYKRHKDYEYVLFYELDAWVFRDELQYWCSKGYDYIGAPWFEGWDQAKPGAKLIGIGNGGFSLRKVNSHLRVLNSFSYIYNPWPLIKSFIRRPSAKKLKAVILNTTIRNNTLSLFNNYDLHEDHFWGLVAAKNFRWFRLPDLETALKFAVEVNPAYYIKASENLPFGCHAWQRYDRQFWLRYIQI